MQTRTGNLGLGFRRGGGEWQKDLGKLIAWAKENDISVIDLNRDGDQTAKQMVDAGMRIGSVDLAEWQGMISPDRAKRQDAIARNAEYVRACAVAGPINYFLVMLPEKPDLPRAENFGLMVDSFAELVPVLEKNNARLAIEGWPGPGALCCTPEGYRALFRELPSKAVGINYDPSHLIRQGIDPIRFLNEFADRVYHIHGKDTELFSENLYEYGHEQPPTFAKRFPYGSIAWRYTIPGHGIMRWGKAFRILADYGYAGCVSIELEDANFNGSEEGEKLGIIQGTHFLAGC
ncbi:MAG: sugar phosphate isomerase/epimerase [Anaerolineae bacterium]|nr:sugar phosphate isomerase/epimerase [Anaerolineae bacterium]